MENFEQFSAYVLEQVERLRKYSSLVNGQNVLPEDLNFGLAHYTEVNLALNAEYQRKKMSLAFAQQEYDRWYDDKFVELRRELNEGKSRSMKIAVKEIESELKVAYAAEFQERMEKITILEAETQFILRLLEQWKAHSQILVTLAQNMRQEMSSLGLGNRMNSVEKIHVPPPMATRKVRED